MSGASRVLLVDDEPMVRDLLSRILRRHGYEVLAASDGSDALEIAAQPDNKIDVVLTDMTLPGLSGQQIAEDLHRRRPNVPIIFMSGMGGSGDLHHPMLSKPFSPAALLDAVALAVSGREDNDS